MNKKHLYLMISTVSLFVLAFVSTASAQAGKKTVGIDTTKMKDEYLEMRGTVGRFIGEAEIDDKLPPVDSALITVFYGGQVYSKTMTLNKGKANFKLPLDQYFKIQVSKKGYVTKFFEVNSKVPKGIEGVYHFDFNLDIFEEIRKLDVSVLKKPIAKVTFDPIYNRFQYDDAYTGRINFELKKMYKNYYAIQKATADSIQRFNTGGLPPTTPAKDTKATTPQKAGTDTKKPANGKPAPKPKTTTAGK